MFALLILVNGVAFPCACQQKTRQPSRYLIPDGYVGWVKIIFRKSDAPALPVEDGHYLLKIPPSGSLETSSEIEYGVASGDDYFYYCGDTRRKLESTGWGGGGMVWGEYNGSSGNNERTELHEGFFIGTEEQMKTLPAGNVGPVDKSKLTCVAR
jgi:hypothetical protein